MANIVITGVNGYIKVVFNDQSTKSKIIKGYFNRNGIAEVIELNGGGVVVTLSHSLGMATSYQFSFDNNSGMQVDLIDTVAPTSDSDLADKLGVLISA
jgi:hypothetical protein